MMPVPMINYEKITQHLQDWKSTVKFAREQRLFSIEPQVHQANTYYIFAIIKLAEVNDRKIHMSDRSQILTLSGLTKDASDMDGKLIVLKEFLKEFTETFHQKVHSTLERQSI